MPKEYKERRIDIEPPKLRTRHAVRTTTAVDPETPPVTTLSVIATYAGGGVLWNPGVQVQDGDAVLWFLRLDNADAEPGSTIRAGLADSGGTPITFSYEARADWGIDAYTYAISSIDGDLEFDSGGNTIVSDYVWALYDQFTGLTAGNHYVSFTIPGTARAQVEAAHLIRGATAATPGTYIYNTRPTPDYRVTYAPGGSVVLNAFPVAVPHTATYSLVYCLYDMTGSVVAVNPIAGYNSVAGTTITTYTYTDPTATPTSMTQGMIAYMGNAGATGSSTSIAAPDENGTAGGGTNTTYTMDVIVINGA